MNELQHFGVLGMKWKHHKAQTQIIDGKYRNKYTDDKTDRYTVLPKGMEFGHVTEGGNKMYTHGPVFIYHNKLDSFNYKGYMAASRMEDVHNMKFTAVEDIVTPTKTKRINEFLELYKDRKTNDLLKTLGESAFETSMFKLIVKFTLNQFVGESAGNAYKNRQVSKAEKKYEKILSARTPKTKAVEDAYQTFVEGMVTPSKARQAFFDRLSKQGFNAIRDDNDFKGYGSVSPLILFDIGKTGKLKEYTKLTDEYVDKQYDKYLNSTKKAAKLQKIETELDHHDLDSYLEHIGIKGMKWGKHKSVNKPISNSEDHIIKTELMKKKVHEMSNTELRKLNERLQLERQYKDLTKTEISPGRKFVTELATRPMKELAFKYGKEVAEMGVKMLIERVKKK